MANYCRAVTKSLRGTARTVGNTIYSRHVDQNRDANNSRVINNIGDPGTLKTPVADRTSAVGTEVTAETLA
jgi:hypothetical protein